MKAFPALNPGQAPRYLRTSPGPCNWLQFGRAAKWLAPSRESCRHRQAHSRSHLNLIAPSRTTTRQTRWLSTPGTKASPPTEAPSFAFAFDIDGVLLHVAKPIPGATEALSYLHAHNIPFILLTNGGGKHEAERVADLSSKLGVPLTVDSFVQSHTPFQELAAQGPGGEGDGLAEKTIFVTGSDAQTVRQIAEQYGFRNVVTPADLLVSSPGIFPFNPLMKEVYRNTAKPLSKRLHGTPGVKDEDALKIDAMFVFNDPRDWALDIQLILDMLLSRQGYLGTYSGKNGKAELPNSGWQQDGQPPLFFSNPDLFWSTTYHLPRFGQGAFQAAVAGVWHRVTGGQNLQRSVIGKPYPETYKFAERVLMSHRQEVLRKTGHKEPRTLNRVYMVGDNPESDIAGANEFQSEEGTEWCSILVRTGVWNPDRGEMVHKPKVIVDDVREAVRWALRREGWKGAL